LTTLEQGPAAPPGRSRPDGSPRTPAEVARQLGWRTVWIAQLNLAIQQRLAGPPPITAPPTVFVSYRWGSTEENAWVAALAVELKRRGYPVIFDQDQPQGDNVDVPGMVSRLAECRYVLCVIDPGYLERLGHEPGSSTKDGWVFDEVNTASAFSNAGRLALIGLLRDGDQLPQAFSFMGPNQRATASMSAARTGWPRSWTTSCLNCPASTIRRP
jgi:hypothetical protein